MSGIVGLIRWDGEEPSAGLARQMADRIAHRGADGVHVHNLLNVSVGYLHLNVTPESFQEAQPLVNERGNVLVADARIDNRAELRRFLNLPVEIAGDSIPDSQLILSAYEKWGADCLDHLIGDFAFVIWEPVTQTIFCGRDHSGVRPFYFHYVPGKYFLFASEIKALWAFPSLPKAIDKSRVANYLCHWGQFNIYQRNTFFEAVSSLPPAHCLLVNEQGASEKMYWRIDAEKYRFETDVEYLAAFKKAFLEAVACRIRTPFPVSAFLSGGLDSSSVSAVASTLLAEEKRTLDTYYIDTELEETSEKEYVAPFLEMHPVQHHEQTADRDYYGSLKEIANITDMPEMFSLTYNHFAPILRGVSGKNSRVMLTGSDGDTVVGYGTECIYEAIGRNDWKEAVRLMDMAHNRQYYQEKFGRKKGHELYAGRMVSVFWKRLPAIFPGRIRSRWHFIKGMLFYLKISPLYLLRIAIKRFSRKTNTAASYEVDPELAAQCTPFMKEGPDHPPTTNLLINSGLYYQMMSEISEYYDIIGARHQVQICHPFFDKRLIELCLFIPAKLKFYEGYGRGPLRVAMRDFLPEKILQRKGKADFTASVDEQLNKQERDPLTEIEENKHLLEGFIVSNNEKPENASRNIKDWQRLHHRILYFLHWRKAQGI
ncbi:asparagine synthase-related protein [Persicitalea sp.]|uniref:asparagine synthase-related protein n=1 Tax=Persicitalea sp. TaxID=3100273 RepID=UPI00359413C8